MENNQVQGLFVSRKENAPDFVKCQLSIRVADFGKWISENVNEKGYVKIDILLSKDGTKLYAKKNEWKKSEQTTNKVEKVSQTQEKAPIQASVGQTEIPF